MKKQIYTVLLMLSALLTTSCGDFLDQDSERVIFADDNHLGSASDTIYSVTGIMNKMQVIADRTILLGELRGDLVDINSNTSSDLRDVALFNVGDSNQYNSPRDYYAIINNCNYFLAKADTAMKNNRNEYIFRREYAAVKAFRAWTYLQLVLNYGQVPFVTEPILTKAESEKDYPKYDIQQVCNYFINDLQPWATEETPNYGTIRNTDSQFFYFPVYILLGDLNLWAGNYKEAALNYYRYISTRNGMNSSYPIGLNYTGWYRGDAHWNMIVSSGWDSFSSETRTNNSELITMIPGDSIPSEGNYSELRNLFNTSADNDYKASIVPSKGMLELSQDQIYCKVNTSGDVVYAPRNLNNEKQIGDMRLQSVWFTSQTTYNNTQVETQSISKFATRNVHIYRRTMVYLRMAEALNRAGYPRFAFAILKNGVNNEVLESDVIPYYQADSTWLRQFDFPTTQYVIRTTAGNTDENTMGIHSHGSGYSENNEYYVFPNDTLADGSDDVNQQMLDVEDRIMDEEGLEFAFEGYRFYDLMRVALRRNDPSYLANRVYQRKGADNVGVMQSEIRHSLLDTKAWYLNWKDQIGLGY